MGGRGSSSGFSRKTNAVLDANAKEITIKTYYRKRGNFGAHYGDIVMEAVSHDDGKISFEKAYGDFDKNGSNTTDVVFKIRHGSVTHFNNGQTTFYGINWENVKEVSGKTYDIKSELRNMGFKWDGIAKKWIKK